MLRDRPNTRKAGIPAAETKSAPMGDDPLAIYKPTDAKSVDAAKAMGSFSGWSYATLECRWRPNSRKVQFGPSSKPERRRKSKAKTAACYRATDR
jgi:hypothetical protein